MELKLHRPHTACVETGRPFVAGDEFVSALVRAEGRLDRRDYTAAAWTGPPPQTLAWWRSRFPAAVTGGTTLAPADVLLDVIEELEGRQDDAALRYLVALELLRRRVLRFVDHPAAGAGDAATIPVAADPAVMVVACRKRDREYAIRVVPPGEATAPGVEERLAALLWSGGAA
ncbi:MAG: hypothetical protein EBX36_09350 [Planctomycetia bacterium]|nr:hypothetical protein [Planctomycetia bacterium]